MAKQSRCEDCMNYVYDEEYDCYTCLVNLDEDEMRRIITGDNYNCPNFRNDEEYELARKQ